MMTIICGLPGFGKAYFARELTKNMAAGYISSDLIRMDIHHEHTYSQEEKDTAYNLMAEHARVSRSLEKKHFPNTKPSDTRI